MRMKGTFTSSRRLPVPRTNFLADVATEEPVANGLAQFFRDRSAQLNREVTDATPRIQLSGSGKGIGWAGVKTGSAGTAVASFVRRINVQFEIEQEGPDKKVTADPFIDQHGVLAKPAEAGPARE